MRIRTSRVPKDLHKVTKDAVKFFCENFLHPRTAARIESVSIVYRKFDKEYADSIAYCDPEDSDEQRRPTIFTIEINEKYRDMKVREYVLTIFHELVHLRQYATGQLRSLNDGSATWKGKNYPEDTVYWLMPWEVEAQGLEVSIYQLFIAKHPGYNLKRYKRRYNGRHMSGWTGAKVPVKLPKNQRLTNS